MLTASPTPPPPARAGHRDTAGVNARQMPSAGLKFVVHTQLIRDDQKGVVYSEI